MQKKIIVIGGGPAGLFSAYKLAEAGLDVLILEKDKWPRYKACGGALSEKSIELLSQEGIKLKRNIIKNEINKFKFCFDFKESFDINYQGEAVKLISRELFDDYLKDIAVDMGAEFRDRSEVKSISQKNKKFLLKTQSQEYIADFIVGADGANSITAKKFNAYSADFLKNKGIALEAEIYDTNLRNSDNNKIMVDFGQIPDGYSWVFPKGDQLSIGLGSLKYNRIKLKEKLVNYLKQIGIDYIEENIFSKGHPLPTFSKKLKIKRSGENYLLIGDAAYLADAFIGEGIYFALLSAKIAAETILKYLDSNRYSINNYELELQNNIFNELEAAEKLALLFYNNSFLVKKVLRLRPDLLKEFIDAVQGKSSYDELLNLFNFLKKIFKN